MKESHRYEIWLGEDRVSLADYSLMPGEKQFVHTELTTQKIVLINGAKAFNQFLSWHENKGQTYLKTRLTYALARVRADRANLVS
jgi:hypothetical protein